MIRNKYLLAILLAAATFTANAAPVPFDTTFDSVSSLKEGNSRTFITGILTDGTPMTLEVPGATSWTGDRCDRKFDLMLTSPGVYTLVVTLSTETITGPTGNPEVSIRFVSCQLTRKP